MEDNMSVGVVDHMSSEGRHRYFESRRMRLTVRFFVLFILRDMSVSSDQKFSKWVVDVGPETFVLMGMW